MTQPHPPRYMITQIHTRTGEKKIVQVSPITGSSVPWESYIDESHCIEIQRVLNDSLMASPRRYRHLDHVTADRDKLINMVEYALDTDAMISLFDDPNARAVAREVVLKNLRQMFENKDMTDEDISHRQESSGAATSEM